LVQDLRGVSLFPCQGKRDHLIEVSFVFSPVLFEVLKVSPGFRRDDPLFEFLRLPGELAFEVVDLSGVLLFVRTENDVP